MFVDDDGLCDGNAPCFTTIQAGVNNATDPDAVLSGAAAEVIVYPGTYAEGADLNLMGSDVGGSAGDIELRAADPNDRPLLNPGAADQGIHALMPFPGEVTIDGFDVAPGSNGGIRLVDLVGAAVIRNVAVEGALSFGVSVTALSNVTVENVSAITNVAAGIILIAGGSVDIGSSAAVNNNDVGVYVDCAGALSIVSASASFNAGEGFLIAGAGAVTIDTASADLNDEDGIAIFSDGAVNILATAANDNSGSGITVEQATEVTIDSAQTNGNVEYGVEIGAAGIAPSGDVTIHQVNAHENGSDGVFAVTFGNALATIVDAQRNGARGVHVVADAGMVLESVNARRNEASGLDLSAIGVIEVSRTTADANGSRGMDIETSEGAVTLTDCTATSNDGGGVRIVHAASATVLNSTASENGLTGVVVVCDGAIHLEHVLASANGGHGVDLTGPGPMTVNRVSALMNELFGIILRPSPGGSFAVNASYVSGNEDGVFIIAEGDELHRGRGGAVTGRVNGSIICDNQRYGLHLLLDMELDARGNWWRNVFGPKHPNNPGVVNADEISDSVNGGAGLVDFSAFISNIDLTSNPPTPFAGMPAELRFLLSDATETFFLGEGPGAEIGPAPFFVSTSNGILETPFETGPVVQAFINNPGGVLTVLLTPGTVGQAVIELEFCGVEATDNVPVDTDCNENGVPDSGELKDNDCNENLVPDDCEPDCNDNGLADDCDLGLLSTQHSTSGNFVIPDNNPTGVTSTFDVVENGIIADVDVGLVIDHTWNGDLSVTLSHMGVSAELIDRPGVPEDSDGFPDNGFEVVLDDDASMPIESFDGSGNKVYGRFRPNSPLAAFDGMDKFGSWTLVVTDHFPTDTGRLRMWTLFVVNDTSNAASVDCNDNRVPDECEADCNENGIADECDIRDGTSGDLNGNGVPDECEPDCNENGIPDDTDVTGVFHYLFNVDPPQAIDNLLPPAADTRTIPDVPVTGIIADVDVGVRLTHEWIADFEIIVAHLSENVVLWAFSCNGHQDLDVIFDDEMTMAVTCTSPLTGRVPPEEPLSAFDGMDIAGDWTLTVSDGFGSLSGELLAWSLIVQRESAGNSADCNENRVPDECEPDCNENGVPDACEEFEDCNGNGVPDECEELADCNRNGTFDSCEAFADCNGNAIPDECDGGCPAGPEQAVPMDDMTTDFKTDNTQGQPCGDCGKMDPLWYLVSLCGYAGVVVRRRREGREGDSAGRVA